MAAFKEFDDFNGKSKSLGTTEQLYNGQNFNSNSKPLLFFTSLALTSFKVPKLHPSLNLSSSSSIVDGLIYESVFLRIPEEAIVVHLACLKIAQNNFKVVQQINYVN